MTPDTSKFEDLSRMLDDLNGQLKGSSDPGERHRLMRLIRHLIDDLEQQVDKMRAPLPY